MSYTDIARKVIATVSGVAQDTLTPEMELVADLRIDSPKALELLVELEDQLGVEIADDIAARLNTVGDILTYVAGLEASSATS